MRKAVLTLRHPQSGIDLREQLAAHETHKAQRVALRDEPTLPVQKLVHLEHMDIAPTNPLAIRDLNEQRVVLRRPHRQNQSARLAAPVPGLNPVRDRAREVVEQSLRVRQQPERSPRPSAQLFHRNPHQLLLPTHGSERLS